VPAPLRDEFDPSKLYDTSHHNRTFGNVFGIKPNGDIAHNGMDHWWDDEGEGNCWEDNESSRGEPTHNFTVPPPGCDEGGSVWSPGTAAVKDAGFLSCSQYDRNDPDFRHPPECNWFDTPPKPSDDDEGDPMAPAGRTAAEAPDAGGDALGLLAIVPLLGTGAALRLRGRARRKADRA
jgi:hypothetical protein